MLGDDDNDNSERLIPAGTEDSAAIGADEIKRLKRKSLKASTANNNGSVAQSQQQIQRAPPAIPAAVPVAAVPAASTRQQPQQQQMQRSQQQQQQRQKQSTAARRKAGPNARQAQLQQQLASNDDEESYVYEPKKGHNLFFLFCDTKRAVLILSSFDFFILALSMSRNWRTAQANGIGFDMSNEFTKKFVTQACALFIDIATIVGALWYSTMIVLVGFLFKCYQLVVSSISAAQNWQNDTEFIASILVLAGLNLLFLYAAGAFMWETHRGILTKENYQRREKYSCCCEC